IVRDLAEEIARLRERRLLEEPFRPAGRREEAHDFRLQLGVGPAGLLEVSGPPLGWQLHRLVEDRREDPPTFGMIVRHAQNSPKGRATLKNLAVGSDESRWSMDRSLAHLPLEKRRRSATRPRALIRGTVGSSPFVPLHAIRSENGSPDLREDYSFVGTR